VRGDEAGHVQKVPDKDHTLLLRRGDVAAGVKERLHRGKVGLDLAEDDDAVIGESRELSKELVLDTLPALGVDGILDLQHRIGAPDSVLRCEATIVCGIGPACTVHWEIFVGDGKTASVHVGAYLLFVIHDRLLHKVLRRGTWVAAAEVLERQGLERQGLERQGLERQGAGGKKRQTLGTLAQTSGMEAQTLETVGQAQGSEAGEQSGVDPECQKPLENHKEKSGETWQKSALLDRSGRKLEKFVKCG
jgi:hypothetical protein